MRSRNRNAFDTHGNVFFVTFTTVGFIHLFNDPVFAEVIIENLQYYQKRGDFVILAYVVMPNHIHLVVTIADGKTISGCIGNLKRITSRQISSRLEQTKNRTLISRLHEAAGKEPADDCRIWKPRFDCFALHDIETIRQKIAYVHNNPVKAGLVTCDVDWPYSSAAAYMGMPGGVVPIDTEWCSLGFDRLRSGRGS